MPQQHNPTHAHAGEYRAIRGDLIRLVSINVLFLAAVIVLFLANRSSGVLDRWAATHLHF